mmetsp:Transcript_9017/g.15486  ORF Transcript_9017/g.15486 Transcript_9017/m.15486 type:complete len:225 (+) Transcript_9017:80-754(+)|eukprot:CAMPEP_0198210082 /NCGR_PEP_ID=MMETSP1445-20131203/19112_1 /TAXON_ID=36898 /ORGANISM="Pyramimonas sp., Strain CCMP2087" /LENGTH=224 /DNA_ID=CAMNT_0043884047 /DNA_START=57 /DNA_END=731 /DNA_ORIENTATION=+
MASSLSMRSALVDVTVTAKSQQVRPRATRQIPAIHASNDKVKAGKAAIAASLAALSLAMPAFADLGSAVRLPPLDPDPKRCERGFVGNTIGQANGVSDRQLDIRFCNFKGADLHAKVLSGSLMSEANFEGADMTEVVLSKAYASKSNFKNADFSNAIIDRATFIDADFTGAVFTNAVITGADFQNANLTNTDFEGALVGNEDVKRLCNNVSLVDESRFSVGCRE